MLLLVGLGNPGPKYENNRHNIGFMAVDDIVRRHSFGPWKVRFQGMISEGRLGTEKVLVLKPATYMNESGRAVGEAVRFYKLNPSDVIVIYDELDIATAKLKVKQGGGNGGHNGLRSMDAHLPNKNYWRVRLGIGHPGDKNKVSGYVLGDFPKAERPAIEKLIEGVSSAIPALIEDGAPAFQNKVALVQKPPQHKNKEGDPKPADDGLSRAPKAKPLDKNAKSKGGLADAFAKAAAKFTK